LNSAGLVLLKPRRFSKKRSESKSAEKKRDLTKCTKSDRKASHPKD